MEDDARAEQGEAGDSEAIRQLFARYSLALDFGDVVGVVSCFTADGVLDTNAPEAGVTGVHRGQEDLQRFVAASSEYSAGRVRSSALNLLIDIDGATARATSCLLVTRTHGSEKAELETSGMFFDELARVDGRWRFARRVYRQDGSPEVLDRLYAPVAVGPRPSDAD